MINNILDVTDDIISQYSSTELLQNLKQLKKQKHSVLNDIELLRNDRNEILSSSLYQKMFTINEDHANLYFKECSNGTSFSKRMDSSTKHLRKAIEKLEVDMNLPSNKGDDDIDVSIAELCEIEKEINILRIELENPTEVSNEYKELFQYVKDLSLKEDQERIYNHERSLMVLENQLPSSEPFDREYNIVMATKEKQFQESKRDVDQLVKNHIDHIDTMMDKLLQEFQNEDYFRRENQKFELDRAYDLALGKFLAESKINLKKYLSLYESEKKKKKIALQSGHQLRSPMTLKSTSNSLISSISSMDPITSNHYGLSSSSYNKELHKNNLPWKIEINSRYTKLFENEYKCKMVEKAVNEQFIQKLSESKMLEHEAQGEKFLDMDYLNSLIQNLATLYTESNEWEWSKLNH